MQINPLRLKSAKWYNQSVIVDTTKCVQMYNSNHPCCSTYSFNAVRIISSSIRNEREYLFVISLSCFWSRIGLPFSSCTASYSSALSAEIREVARK